MRLIVFIGLTLVVGVSFAGVNPQKVSCTLPTERADQTPLSIEEIQAIRIYCSQTSGSYNTVTETVDKSCNYSFNLPEGQNYCVLTTVDTADRESDYSTEVALTVDPDTVIITLNKAMPPEFTLDRIGETDKYTLNVIPPTKDIDGNDLPPEVISKHFLFINDAWVKDIFPDKLPYEITLKQGVNNIQMETEIAINDVYKSSDKTAPLVIDHQPPEVDPNPPSDVQEIVIPDGATDIVIQYRLKQE